MLLWRGVMEKVRTRNVESRDIFRTRCYAVSWEGCFGDGLARRWGTTPEGDTAVGEQARRGGARRQYWCEHGGISVARVAIWSRDVWWDCMRFWFSNQGWMG